uniref:Uncharacterized protein n=1 Tax=Gerbera hybrida TaxID=18101 RepID=O82685_GERHY|nr:hypothetical protein [Gerbera hybrid cultivar]
MAIFKIISSIFLDFHIITS